MQISLSGISGTNCFVSYWIFEFFIASGNQGFLLLYFFFVQLMTIDINEKQQTQYSIDFDHICA